MIGDVRGKGLMIGIELVVPGETTPAPKAAARVLEKARSRGCWLERVACTATSSGSHHR